MIVVSWFLRNKKAGAGRNFPKIFFQSKQQQNYINVLNVLQPVNKYWGVFRTLPYIYEQLFCENR